MAFKRVAAAAGTCMFLASGAFAQTATGVGVVEGPAKPAAVLDKSWPIVLSRPGTQRAVPTQWSQEELEAARARCAGLLNGLEVVAVPEAPLREGAHCGNAAPMKLVSIGRGPNEVTFSPPPLVTCELIAGLAKWLQQDVQGLARKHLGASVTRIEAMSSYSCRNAYGRPGNRLSEHGRVNALDIAAFVTAKNQMVSIETDWGVTAREIASRHKRDDEAQPQPVIQNATNVTPRRVVPQIKPVQPEPIPTAEASILPSLPGISLHFSTQPSALGFDQPSRLGGPKTRNAPVAVIPPPPPPPGTTSTAGRTQFLRNVHRAGCKIFGTVLGPEANKTHSNHFHVDMAERIQNTKVCE